MIFLKGLLVLVVLSHSKAKEHAKKGDGAHRKHVVVVSPQKSHSSDVVVIGHHGNEGSGEQQIDRETITSLSNNVMSATNLLHSQSDFIKNLGKQLDSLEHEINEEKEKMTKAATGSEEKYLEIKESQKNVTKLVNALVVMWTQSEKNYVKIIKDIKQKIKEDNINVEKANAKMERRLKALEKKLDIIEVGSENARRLAASKRSRWPRGHYCIFAYGACPVGFRKHYGFLRGVYVYGTSRDYVKSASFGSSYIGCHSKNCGGYGNNYASLNMETCCK